MVISMVIGIVADLNRYLLSVFLRDGAVYPNTLLAGRLISFGLDPIRCAVTETNIADKYRQGESGVIESLQHLLVSENFIKPWSAEHSLVTLLTSCFWSDFNCCFIIGVYYVFYHSECYLILSMFIFYGSYCIYCIYSFLHLLEVQIK